MILFGVSFLLLVEICTISYFKFNIQNYSKLTLKVTDADYNEKSGARRNSKSSVFIIKASDHDGSEYELRSKYYKNLYKIKSIAEVNKFRDEIKYICVYVNNESYFHGNFIYINDCNFAIAECRYVDPSIVNKSIIFSCLVTLAFFLFKTRINKFSRVGSLGAT